MVFTDDDKGEVKFTTAKTDGQLEISAEDFIKFAKEHENKDVSFSASKEPDTFSTYFPFENDKASDNSADVVEVVRCKECKYRHQTTCPFLIANAYRTSSDDDYCSRGERREDGEIH